MALINLKNKTYPISRVTLHESILSGSPCINLLIELEGNQCIDLKGYKDDSTHVMQLLNSMKFLITNMENDVSLIDGDMLIDIAEKIGIHRTLNLRQLTYKNKEGVFIKMPIDTTRYKANYIFLSAETFGVSISIIQSPRGVEAHLTVSGNRNYVPTLILYYNGGYNDYGIMQGAKNSASSMAQAFQNGLFQNSKQGYIDFEKVVKDFTSNGAISDLSHFEIMTKYL